MTGEVDRDEWNETVDFYLELKEEEKEELKKQEKKVDKVALKRAVREEKLQSLQNATHAQGTQRPMDIEAGRAETSSDDDENEA